MLETLVGAKCLINLISSAFPNSYKEQNIIILQVVHISEFLVQFSAKLKNKIQITDDVVYILGKIRNVKKCLGFVKNNYANK